MMLPKINRERVVTWVFGVGLFIFLLTFVAMPAVNDAFNSYNENVTRSIAYAESTQQYNKIYLTPFYLQSMSSGIPVNFSVAINPPDRISSVTSAIISFNAQINGQTQNFTLLVNNQPCRPASYYIATAFSTTGNIQFSFDCSNVIKASGNYSMRFVSDVNTGAVSGWLDLTYLNNPRGQVKYMGGTDYWQGEKATVFLQLQDASGTAVNNASCNFDLYNATNPLAAPIYNKQPMVFRGADGIYYYQFLTTGYPEGVYPIDAECTYVYDNYYFYEGVTQAINVTTNTGTFTGGNATNLNAYGDDLYMEWTLTQNLTFIWDNVTNSTGNVTKIALYWLGETSIGRTLTFYAYNYTSSSYNIILGSLLTTGAGSTTTPTGVSDIFTAQIPSAAYNGTTVRVIMSSSGSSTMFINWLTLKAFRNSTYVSEVKGSSEVHIYSTNITNAITGTAQNMSEIISYLQQINLTTQQILVLSQTMNLTAKQTFALLQSMNLTQVQILNLATQINNTSNQMLASLNDNFTKMFANLTAIQGWENRYFLYWNNTVFVNYNNNFTDINSKLVAHGNQLTTALANLTQILNNLTFIQNNQSYQNVILVYWNNTLYPAWTTNFSVINTKLDNIYAKNATVDLTNIYNNLSKIIGFESYFAYWNNTLYVGWNNNFTYIINKLNSMNASNLTASDIWNYVGSGGRTLTDYNNTGIYNMLLQVNTTVGGLGTMLSQILYLSQQMNLTTQQTLTLAQSINLTTVQILQLLQSMNLTQAQIQAVVGQINLTVNDIRTMVYDTNLTVNQILNISQNLSLTAQQTLALATDINLTSHQMFTLLQAMNLTQSIQDFYLSSINATVTLNRNDLQYLINISSSINLTAAQTLSLLQYLNASSLGYLSEINTTTHNNALSLQQILGIANQTNLTTQQIMSLLSVMNATIESKLDTLNSTAYLLLNMTGGINSTVGEINLTVNQILSAVQGINFSQAISYLQEINATVHYSNISIWQLLEISGEINITSHQAYSLLQSMNITFEQKLDVIDGTVNNISVGMSQLISLANSINMTSYQSYQLLLAMNLTQSQIFGVLAGMNLSVSQILNLSNLTYITTGEILQLSLQTNSTVSQILGIVQGLNISINQTLSGNITLSTNLTSSTINDISEKVWLQFLTLGTPPPMPSTSYYCSSNVTLVKNITFDVCSGAGCKQYTKLTNTFCEFGCDPKNNQCVPSPINRMGIIAVVVIGIIGFVILIRRFV